MGEIKMDMIPLDEVETSQNNEPLKESPFLVPFFNFFHYFLLIPFQITLNTDENLYQLKSTAFRKIFCGLAHLIVFVVYGYSVIFLLLSTITKEPAIVIAFDITSNLSMVAAFGIIINLLWRRQKDFLQIIECTRLSTMQLSKGKFTLGFVIYAALFMALASLSIINWCAVNEHNHFDIFALLDKKRANLETNKSEEEDPNKKWPHLIIHAFFLYTSIFHLIVEGILLVVSLSLRQLGREFAIKMKNVQVNEDGETSEAIDKGIVNYRELKQVSETVRRVYGAHLLAYYVASVSYYAEAPHLLLGKRGDIERVILIYFVASGVVWILAADFHHYTRKTMQRWIQFHTDSPSLTLENRLKLLAVSNDIYRDPISLSSKYFRVTYAHIGTMVGLVLTYGIIVYQLYHKDNEIAY